MNQAHLGHGSYFDDAQVASALSNEQNLTTWMNMPIQLCTGAIGRLSNAGVEGAVSYIQLVQPNFPCEVLYCGQITLRKDWIRRLCESLESE